MSKKHWMKNFNYSFKRDPIEVLLRGIAVEGTQIRDAKSGIKYSENKKDYIGRAEKRKILKNALHRSTNS